MKAREYTELVKRNRPFLRWAGSKRQHISTILKYWGQGFSRYIEPFAGSGAVFFALQPKKAVLSDINLELVKVFQLIKSSPEDVALHLTRMTMTKKAPVDQYYHLRSLDISRLSEAKAAARFLYLNRYCFNGLYRTNMKGQFNVPYGGNRVGSLPTADDLQQASLTLKGATIKCADFQKTIASAKEGDFVYLDPPFAVRNRRVFRQYHPDTFGLEDLDRLFRSLIALDERRVSFLLSYAYSPEIAPFLKQWSHRRIRIRRNISGFACNRRTAVEVLVTNILQKGCNER